MDENGSLNVSYLFQLHPVNIDVQSWVWITDSYPVVSSYIPPLCTVHGPGTCLKKLAEDALSK